MPPRLVIRWITLAAAVLFSTTTAVASAGGWVTIRNDTNKVVVVQETVVQDGQVKRLRPVRLLPGESFRQYEHSPGTKAFELYDGQNPAQLLYTGSIRVTDANRVFAVAAEGRSVVIREVQMPAVGARKP